MEERITNYEEKYKQLHKFVSDLYPFMSDYCKEKTEGMIPELKDNDENIRKALIRNFTNQHSSNFPTVDGFTREQIIYWLKKQGQKSVGGNKIETEINLVDILKHYPKETELYSPLYGKLWLAKVDERNGIITCYKYPLDRGCVRAIIEQEDTVSFYSNGTTGLPDFNVSEDCMLFLYDTKKQCEQKTTCLLDNSVFNVKFPFKAKVKSNGKIVTIHDGQLSMDCKEWIKYQSDAKDGYTVYASDDLELVGSIEQKPADKVEPKFKVRDWVIVQDKLCQIEKVTELPHNHYQYWTTDEHWFGDGTEARLWSIEDVKDGDVLVYHNGATEIIILFKFWDVKGKTAYTHFHVFDNIYRINDFCVCGNGAHPATKKQRDLLFAKMKEAGYEWDAEKKELKKIEQKQDVNMQINSPEYINDMGGNGCYLKNTAQNLAWSENIKGFNELETYILSLVPDRSLDAIKVDTKNIRHIINKEQSTEWSKRQVVNALTKWLTEKIAPLHKKSLDGTINEREEMFKAALLEMRSFVNSPGFQIGKDISAE